MLRGLLLVLIVFSLSSEDLAVAQAPGSSLTPGTILVASEKLGDPHFAETVVLIIRREKDGGVMGLVLNRPMNLTLAKAFPQLGAGADAVFDGGPVSPDALQALLRSSEKVETATHVSGDVYSVVRKTLLEKSISDHLPSSKFRVFLGYAGWGPGQLENEVRLGAWTTMHASKYIFDGQPESLWQRLNRDTHSQLALR